ncbi:MAG TPA: MATE family efflux transporter [Candidatus Elarobacter sp.]|nr:MATE family efflux transporter [Candidatus Elarobacter sp.]
MPDPSVTVFDPHEEGVTPLAVTGEWEAAKLVRAPLPRTILRLGLPAVASMLLMTLFYTADMLWIGRFLGPTALAAGTTSVFWIWLVISIAELVSIGLTSLAARRHGERRPDEAARVVGEAIVFSIVLGCAVAIVGTLMLDSMFGAMDVSPAIVALGRRYLGTYLIGAPLFFGFFAVDAGFRASGNTRTPLAILTVSIVATLILDPVLILGIGPVPRLGIAGAAIATVATRTIAFVIGVYALKRRGMVHFGRVRAATVGAITRVGLPTAVTGIGFSLIYIVLTRSIAPFGTPALAALGIGHRVESWLYTISVGFGAAVAAIVGQNIGAGEWRRAEQTGWITVGYVMLPALVLSALELAAAPHFAGIFTTDAATRMHGAEYLRISALSNMFLGAEVVLEAALGGAGTTLPPMLTSTALTAARVPLAAWGASRYGLVAVWWVIVLTAAARGIAMAALWKSGFWKRQRSIAH